MANTRLEPLLIALALLPAACDRGSDREPRSSITVELPPARPPIAAPGFSLEAAGRPASPVRERVSKALQELASTGS